MRLRQVVLLVGLLALIGCRTNWEGPREIYWKNRAGDRPDLPGYTIEQQEQRGRERLSTPSDNWRVGPPIGLSGPDPTGRW
jgi:hypothetical protein